ncbi:olfactory receptor 1E5-like [Eublepharis macularius]|uniref:Olfactory receptor n=1 Tax=Eublepharis macularius TaxID=481883 RepID=A0AA97KQ79_EUBMA|nr:olfactory receptor 1E5-like [Eublepharis macularius]
MEQRNQTFVSEFILQGLFTQEGYEGMVFSILLFMYLLSLLGNLLIVLLIRCDAHLLRTPMYFFLSHLSLADVGFASSIVPVTLRNLVAQDKIISYSGCLSQMYFFSTFGNSDNFLLAAMAYDRYLAICLPLHYTGLMNRKRCLWMVSGCWLLALCQATLYTSMVSVLSFCAAQKIPHFFCDVYPLIGLSCSDTTAIKMVGMTDGILDILGPFILIVFSYARIFLTVMKVPSSSSKRKAFSTCGSHLTAVILFYGTLCWVYMQPTSENNTLASLMYTVVTPMLNPFIYSLRNNELKSALKRGVGQLRISQTTWK